MPQAKLPDINAAWVRYRNYGLNCIDFSNYPGTVAAINEINALLPDTYRVKIDSREYRKLERDNYTVICPKCNDETTPDQITSFYLRVPMIVNHQGQTKQVESWDCKKCKSVNNLVQTRMQRKVMPKPYYHGIIPDPPDRKDGVLDRTKYHNDLVKWFFDALEELDHMLGKYREEYKPLDELDDGGYFVGQAETDD